MDVNAAYGRASRSLDTAEGLRPWMTPGQRTVLDELRAAYDRLPSRLAWPLDARSMVEGAQRITAEATRLVVGVQVERRFPAPQPTPPIPTPPVPPARPVPPLPVPSLPVPQPWVGGAPDWVFWVLGAAAGLWLLSENGGRP